MGVGVDYRLDFATLLSLACFRRVDVSDVCVVVDHGGLNSQII
jgi:hypothetical protein